MGRLAGPAAAAIVGLLLVAGCGDGAEPPTGGLSRAEVEAIAREQLAQATTPPQAQAALTAADVREAIAEALANLPRPEPGLPRAEVDELLRDAIAALPAPEQALTAADVEEAIAEALANLPRPEQALTAADVERITRGLLASIPSKSAPGEYTRFVVDSAISRYEATGLDATLAYYNDVASIDGQWYVFIIDADDTVIGHYDPGRRDLDLKGWVGTDVNGYNFGPEMLSATGDGKWVSYVYRNPATGDAGSEDFGDLQLKNAWVVRHDGLLFGSGWYIDADEFTRTLVATAVELFRAEGLAGTVEHFLSGDSVTAGLAETIDYYNNAEHVAGQWFAFIADSDGTVVAHDDPALLGTNLEDLFGAGTITATEGGNWVTTDGTGPSTGRGASLRVWVVSAGGMTFGAGWTDGAT